jgi:hypothetical protein
MADAMIIFMTPCQHRSPAFFVQARVVINRFNNPGLLNVHFAPKASECASPRNVAMGHNLTSTRLTADVALFASCRLGRAEIPFFNGSAHAVGKQPCSFKLEKLSGRSSSIGARRCVHAA